MHLQIEQTDSNCFSFSVQLRRLDSGSRARGSTEKHQWVIKGSKHSVGYLSTGLCNNSSSCKENTVAVQDTSGLPLETLPLRSLHHEGLPLETTQPQRPILPPLAWVNSGGQASPAMLQTPKVLCLKAGPSADLENRCDHSCFLRLHYHAQAAANQCPPSCRISLVYSKPGCLET